MSFTTRPTLRGSGGAVSAGHYLASTIGAEILWEGGNAADAACAMGLALQVLEPHMNGPAGEVPIIFFDAKTSKYHVICGQGVSPASASVDKFVSLGLDRIPGSGLLGATVPGAFGAWCELLERFGTTTFERIATPALRLAREGFPNYGFLRDTLHLLSNKFKKFWPSSAEVYLPVSDIGDKVQNLKWADTLESLILISKSPGKSRDQGIRKVRDSFYCGKIAEEIESFMKIPACDDFGNLSRGLLSASDMSRHKTPVEQSVSLVYRNSTVHKCSFWSQGPVFLQQLQLLAGFDLSSMGSGTPDTLHTIVEAAKLAFADREACYGDPQFSQIPEKLLLSEEYAEKRRILLNNDEVSFGQRPGVGRLPAGWPWIEEGETVPAEPQAFAASKGRGDTTHLDAVDTQGNMVSATPSGAWIMSSPVIPSLGFPLGTRAQMFSLDPDHPNCVEPNKRPRTTLTPSMAELQDGRRIAFGTPGGDQQDQWTLQFFLEIVDFDPSQELQAAIDAPTVHSLHMPSSFYPRTAKPGWMAAESRIDAECIADLSKRGHRIVQSGPWEHGRVMAVTRNPDSGLCEAASSPRSGIAYSIVLP